MNKISQKPSESEETTETPVEPPEESEKKRRPERPRTSIPPDTILIGKKPVMTYVTAVMMHFMSGATTLTVKARGRAISTAVDVVEVARRRFFNNKLKVKNITIGTQTIQSFERGETRNVSTIEIQVEKTE